MDFNSASSRQSLTAGFPRLASDVNFKVTSPCTYAYNCIAFAMGVQDRWVDPAAISWHWWPDGVPKDNNPESLVAAFEKLSFVKCNDASFEGGFDKVALYSKDGKWTHAAIIKDARQNLYHSKFGASFDALHSGGNVLENVYGEVFQYMKRPVDIKDSAIASMGATEGTTFINLPGLREVLVAHMGSLYYMDGRPFDRAAFLSQK